MAGAETFYGGKGELGRKLPMLLQLLQLLEEMISPSVAQMISLGC